MLYDDITEVLQAVDAAIRQLEHPLDRYELAQAIRRQCKDIWCPEFVRDSIALMQSNKSQTAETSDGRLYQVKDELRHKIERFK